MTRRTIGKCFSVLIGLLPVALAGCGPTFYLPNPVPDPAVVEAIRGGGGGGETSEAAASTGAGWGTLKGQFVLEGAPPQLPLISTAGKDPLCPAQVPNQTVVVDSATKGIANILVFARKPPRVFKPEGDAQPGGADFDQNKCIFLSHVMGVSTASPVSIKNSDAVLHNTNLSPPGNPAFNQSLPPKSSASYKFNKQLSLPVEVVCNIHPWMKAYILARDDPYFAVTAQDGTFEIKNVPAGEDVEFQVWQEKTGTGLDAPPLVARGRFKVNLEADQTKDLGAIAVPASAFQ